VVPLINIVFLLLIFFMLAGSLRSVEPFAVELPKASSSEHEPQGKEGEKQQQQKGEEEASVLFVGANGELALDGRRLDEDALVASLSARSGGDSLQLHADARIPARRFLPLLDRLRGAGVTELELVVSDER
jgi:biopolymer transport protein ExbD